MKKISSAGLLYLCLTGDISDGEIKIQQINTYNSAFHFYEQSKRLSRMDTDIILFAVIGIKNKIEKITTLIDKQIKNNFYRIMEKCDIEIDIDELDSLGNDFNQLIQEHVFLNENLKFPRKYIFEEAPWKMQCFWAGDSYDDKTYILIDSAVKTWLSYEKPMILGKQLVIQSFQLADLSGRKIIGVFPNIETKEWVALLDGGIKLSLSTDIPYIRERIGIKDIGQISIGDVDMILNNPVYSYGKWLYPTEIYEEWHKVFLYVAGLQKCEWNEVSIQNIYEKFLRFMEENICNVMQAEPMIIKEQYYKSLVNNVLELKQYLMGEDISVISRDLWLLLNSRYIYLPYIYELFCVSLGEVGWKKEKFQLAKMNQLIEKTNVQDNYQKGINWEKAVEYFLNHIDGLEVSGRRVKTIAQEIDLSIVNISLDHNLWEMGAYILVECKNWTKRVGIQVIRELTHISELKGNKTTLLFAANGVTRDAEREIIRSAVNGKYILFITKNELRNLQDEEACYNLLVGKWEELQNSVNMELFV